MLIRTTVDEEIYRYAPSLVIATVDKLAQLPWKGYAGMLFGRVRQRCSRHGYRHEDLDADTGCAVRHHKKDALPAVTSQPVPRLRPPDLIIQDELHLISGALGTTVGLFESAVDELCTWTTPAGTEAGPKIVASTATTKRAAEQVRGVFGRSLEIFPPQVLDVADTFFSRQVPVTEAAPGRRYLGICAHGVRLKSAEIRLAEILLLAGQTLFDSYGEAADPYLTLVGYFNATRELAGMRRYLDDDVATRVRRHGRSKGLSDRLVGATAMLTIQELTSRISSGDISDVLKHLEIGFDAELDTTARRRAINENVRDVYANRDKAGGAKDQPAPHPLADRSFERRKADRIPVDVVLATSMLQVGVDVSRFGLMVVTGQPKNTAEYIQASSRVGRSADRPGLVVTLYNWTRPRDLAHYEDFEHYHSTFYRQVEALSVAPVLRAHTASGVSDLEAAAYLRGLAAGHEHATTAVTVETVWSGPGSHVVPVRATAQALLEVIAEAEHDLVLMTYSAKPHPGICTALTSAVSRGVSVSVVVETLQGAGSALSGSEPAAAFGGTRGVQLWHWPVLQRSENGSKMHAKLAVADQRVLFVSSANLTQSGVVKNIEAGLLVRGGTAPQRAAEHIAELKATGVLVPLRRDSHSA